MNVSQTIIRLPDPVVQPLRPFKYLYRRRWFLPAPLAEHDELRHVDPAATQFDGGDPPLRSPDLRRQLALGELGALPHLLQEVGDFPVNESLVGFCGHGPLLSTRIFLKRLSHQTIISADVDWDLVTAAHHEKDASGRCWDGVGNSGGPM